MAVSKLFTPRLRASQATPIEATENTPIFVNPPTHPEIPFFSGKTDTGDPHYPLSLGGERGSSTKPNKTLPISAKPQERMKY